MPPKMSMPDMGGTCKCPKCGTMLKLEAAQAEMPQPGGDMTGDQDTAPSGSDLISSAAGQNRY